MYSRTSSWRHLLNNNNNNNNNTDISKLLTVHLVPERQELIMRELCSGPLLSEGVNIYDNPVYLQIYIISINILLSVLYVWECQAQKCQLVIGSMVVTSKFSLPASHGIQFWKVNKKVSNYLSMVSHRNDNHNHHKIR